jgi:4-hydroxy-2-oxoheptanedioate aldolase
MLSTNKITTALDSKGLAVGTWAQMNSPEFCEVAARSGLDFVIVDMEHGSFGIEAAVSMIRAVEAGGAASIVRVPDASRTNILKVLDAGANVVLVPNVETRATAESIVSAARYTPVGRRGACPCVRATAHGVEAWGDYLAWSDKNVLVGVLVETPEGLRNFEDIVSVPGLDIIAMGPFDLSQALGLGGDWKHPEVRRKQEEMIRIARHHDLEVMAATFDSNPEDLRRQVQDWKRHEVRMFAVSGDRFMLSSGYKSIVSSLSPLRAQDHRLPERVAQSS